jgi:putative SOS response-associated peptidase YedK
MCGRVIQASPPGELALEIVEGLEDRDYGGGGRYGNVPPRYNGAPSQELWVIRRDAVSGRRSLDLLRWGLLPSVLTEKPKPPPINARSESVATSRLFGRAYAKRRCIVPVDGFFEWHSEEGKGPKQPFAIAMKDRRPFALAGIWENWRDPATDAWIRTFCILTTGANAAIAPLHTRMPVILEPADYERWLSDEPGPRDLLRAYPAEPLDIWPVSTRVNGTRIDEASLLEPIPLPQAPTMQVA